MSHKRIKPTKHHRPRTDPSDLEDWTGIQWTPILNAAFSVLMKDSQFREAARVQMCILRYSWGNWLSHAIQRKGWEADLEPGAMQHLQQVMFGNKPCPFCGEIAGDQTKEFLPRNFRWHRECVALAYARDAAELGDEEQQKWAADIMAGKA